MLDFISGSFLDREPLDYVSVLGAQRPIIEAEGDVILHCDQGSEGLGVRGQRPRMVSFG